MLKDFFEWMDGVKQKRHYQIDGRNYFFGRDGLNMIEEPQYYANAIKVNSLTGLVDYIEMGELKREDVFIAIVDTRRIELLSGPDYREKRNMFVYTEVDTGNDYAPGNYIDLEEFVIYLKTGFQEIEDDEAIPISKITDMLSSIKDSKNITFEDDGFTQNIIMKNELQPKSEGLRAEIPNPLKLRPYRTFREIDQPLSTFLLRLRRRNNGIDAALIESYSRTWINDARLAIKDWLKDKVDLPIIA